MAVSDLHSRLDYLVAYSSQLVLVGNDDLQFQQSALQAFIAQQHENLEVAFLKGEPGRSAEDYRKEICRQILHKTTGQFDRSLRIVLQDFDTVENPILICLCAAQHLPQKLLEEMWELVLLARTLTKNLHVNVLLFGDSKWVIDAKSKLPTNKGNKPILLATDFDSTAVRPGETQQLTELDALIANKRAAFAQRVQDRASVDSAKMNKQSLIQTTKFKIAIGIVFLVTFTALVLWFYPQQTKSITPASTESSSPIESANTTPIDLPTEMLEPVLNEPAPTETVDSVAAIDTVETIETDKTVEADQITESKKTDEINKTSKSNPESLIEPKVDQLLVTQWDNTSKSVEPESIVPASVVPESVESKSVEPASELASTTEKLPISPEAQITEMPLPSVHPLESVEQGQFLIQVLAIGNLQAAKRFIQDNSLDDTTWLYTTTRFNGSWHVIVYKKLFKSRKEARSYIPEFSEKLKKSSPFVKSIEQIQEEIAIAN